MTPNRERAVTKWLLFVFGIGIPLAGILFVPLQDLLGPSRADAGAAMSLAYLYPHLILREIADRRWGKKI